MVSVKSKHYKAYKDYKRGMSYLRISIKYNVSLSTVYSWKSRYWNQSKPCKNIKRQIKPKKKKGG